ncbi:MAG: ribonuclease R [Lachnospiraceae bacterium]|nr:ribonuclease R [Lachnospiraceae bacterium]
MEKEEFEKRKRVIYDFMCDELYVPMKLKEIAAVLNIPKEQRSGLREVLDALLAEGKAELSAKGKYRRGHGRFITGVFTAHAKGYGFVTAEGETEDIFIAEENAGGAFHEDVVQIITVPSGGKRREARVVKILEHGIKTLVGTYEKSAENYGFVIPDNPRIGSDVFVPSERSKGAVTGHKVVVELTSYGGPARKEAPRGAAAAGGQLNGKSLREETPGEKPQRRTAAEERESERTRRRRPEGRIIEVIGHVNDPGTDILSLVRERDLPTEFPAKVLNQAERVSKPVSEADRAGRLDLRGLQTVTIDGEDAKDLDDAVTLTVTEDGYELGVHIADVSNYVQEHSALDVEALKRGTSVYLPDRVIPMLPHTLSNGICSLNQGEERLALSCIMTVDRRGNIADHKIAETVIRVDRRMTYADVDKIITQRDEKTAAEYADFVPMFFSMKELADLLRAKRRVRGSIDFDFPETKVVLDEAGHPTDILPCDRSPATRIIEDFMLAANETVAEDYFWQEIPFMYRTHEKPDAEKIRRLSTFINNFGYHIHIGSGEVHPKELQKLLGRIENTPAESMISRLILRSMKRAVYSVECVGHFGLAAKYYCHFTSPIRRYPDLQIHRIIKDGLRGRMDDSRREHYEKILPEAARQSSETERRADETEREAVKMKKVEYMEAHIGEIYEGVISGITQYGLYVELPNTIEGLVHVTDLCDDYYNYIEDTYEMVGEHTGRSYKLGQTVTVRASGADRLMRTIDFDMI